MAIRVFHRDKPDVMLPLISKDARLVVWPGVGSESANMNYVRMEPGEANVPHRHASSEDTIYILAGEGTVTDYNHDRKLEFRAGDVILSIGDREPKSDSHARRILASYTAGESVEFRIMRQRREQAVRWTVPEQGGVMWRSDKAPRKVRDSQRS